MHDVDISNFVSAKGSKSMKPGTPLLSIIVPIYNSEQFLSACIESVLAQTYTNFELILVDDCSSDSSHEVCRRFATEDKRIKVITLKKNSGVSVARNEGLEIAKGEFIGFVDSDDTVERTYLSTLLTNAEAYSADISIVRYKKTKKSLREESGDVLVMSPIDALNMIADRENGRGFVGYVWGKLFRQNCIANIRFNPNLCLCEDYLFSVNAFTNARCVVLSGLALYTYINRSGSAVHAHASSPDKWYTKYLVWKEISFIAEAYPGTEFQIRARRERFIAIVAYAKLLCAAGRSAELKEPAYQKELKESAAGVPMKRVPRNTRIKYLLLRLCLPLFSKIFGAGK